MIVDTSALVAIHEREADGRVLRELLRTADPARISAGTLLESQIVLDRRQSTSRSRLLDKMVITFALEIVPVDTEQVIVARAAYRDFGRGSGHPANLNFGDCFSYALATVTGEPLLYKGNDFGHTDVRSALA